MGATLRASASIPVTLGLVAALVATDVVLHSRSVDLDAVVAWSSTNIHNLGHHPIAAMLSSAFVVPDGLLPELVVLAVAFAFLERRIGAWRSVAIALTGHVVATLLTEYGLDVGLHLGWFPDADLVRSDVGVSYVMYTVLAASTLLLRGRRRLLAVGVVVALVAVPFVLEPGMTPTGHVLSVAIGLIAMFLVLRRAGYAPVSGESSARP